MTIQQVRKLHQAKPFQAFRIHLADGRSFEVSHPELLAILPPGRTIVVGTGQPEDYEVVDLLLVTSLEVSNGRPRSGKGRH
jgi:hypothetical protein